MIKKGAFVKMENNGFIVVYRKTLDNPVICKDNDHFRLWLQLLLSATHKNVPVVFDGKRTELVPGQLITGRNALAKECGISSSKIERILECFETEQQIKQQTCSKGRLITIVNWSEYQDKGLQNKQQVDSKRTTSKQQANSKRTASEQRVDTNNNDNNDNNDNNVNNVNKRIKKASAPAEPPPFTGAMLDKVNEWLQFKKERKSTYTPTGQRALYKRIQSNIDRLGEEVVISCIDKSISNNWQGLFFPDIKPKTANSDDDFFVKVARGEIEI